ncbi:hypothetical protein AK812_SmicGene35243 [Symbiodinium microadriaticum]|uniref:Uncharacterized protein n=1 Tax=Symbiodinium microadriaticum TaxID=2951 RepID=A0A1Q9CLX6_SYMMI|nr:hypothetical protein AK812_SmicGene35243 [Symbiodinium microadriaticum]
MEMELEALKRGSDGGASVAEGGQAADLAAALKEQTEALKEALSARGGSNSITTVKTDLVWPTLTDDKSDTKDVVLFYEEFEDVCALANNCRGMSAREKLLALRARCKGSRAKTYTNAYRAAWKTGEVVDDPEEREVRIDGEHQALVKGRLSGHQFEPLFEASVADLESVGLGKTARELYLSYLRKMPPHLQKEIRQDKRIWPGDAKEVGLRSPAMWEESHKVVLEYEQREAQKEIRELKAAAQAAAARPSGAAAKDSTLAAGSGAKGGGKGAAGKICFHFRDHGNCPKGDSCPFSHDKELRKQALAAKRGESTLAAKGGKGVGEGSGKAKPKAKPKAAAKSSAKPPGTVCPFFQKTGSCRKGANCDMVHSLLAGQGQSLPTNWGPPSGASMSNPFAAFSIQIGSAGVQAGLPAADPKGAVREHALAFKKGESGRFSALDELPGDWSPAATSTGQWFRCWAAVSSACSTGALGRTMSPRLEKWVHPEFVHGIASGAPVPLKGAAVLRVTLLLEGKTPEGARAGPEIFEQRLARTYPRRQGPTPYPGYAEYQDSSVRGLHSRQEEGPAYAFEARLSGRNKASRTLEPDNTPPRPPSGPRAEARAVGVEFAAGAASTEGAQPAADPPAQPIVFSSKQFYRWGSWVCYFCEGVNPPEADECFYQPVGGPHVGARCSGNRAAGSWCPDDNVIPWSAPEEWRNTWEADRLRDYEDEIPASACQRIAEAFTSRMRGIAERKEAKAERKRAAMAALLLSEVGFAQVARTVTSLIQELEANLKHFLRSTRRRLQRKVFQGPWDARVAQQRGSVSVWLRPPTARHWPDARSRLHPPAAAARNGRGTAPVRGRYRRDHFGRVTEPVQAAASYTWALARRVLNRLAHICTGNISTWAGVAAALAAPVLLSFQRGSVGVVDETLAAVAQQSTELVQEVGAEAARTVQVAGRAVSVITLMISAAATWFVAQTVLNRLAHALTGNSLPATLVQLVGGEATFAVKGKRSQAMHKGRAGMHCDAAVQAAVQMGLVRADLAALGVLQRLGSKESRDQLPQRPPESWRLFPRSARSDVDCVGRPSPCGCDSSAAWLLTRRNALRPSSSGSRIKRVATAGVSVRLAAGHSVRDACLSDGRGATVGAGLKGLHHAKALLVVGETTAELIVGSLNWSTSSKANSECGLRLTVASGAPVVVDFIRDCESVFAGASALDDAKPPAPKGAAASSSARQGPATLTL